MLNAFNDIDDNYNNDNNNNHHHYYNNDNNNDNDYNNDNNYYYDLYNINIQPQYYLILSIVNFNSIPIQMIR